MPEVGDLAVVLDARTKEFRAALDQAEKRITKFEKKAEADTEKAAKSFGKLGGSIGGLKSAVTGLIAAFGAWKALQLGKEAVGLAASYESIQIRIGTLTGSVDNAATIMKDLNRLVLETPYSLEEIANAAASMAVTFKDNTDAVTEFTGYTADLAAAFGRPVELIGENLTRAFSAGLGAADAFREAGISQYIVELSGKTKVADVTTQDLMDAIRKMASEGGVAYQAAARRADSLEGVLSNTGIAASNLKRAFGEALSPAVVRAGKEVLQPFFERLKVLIEENEDAIQRFGDNLATVVDWMTHMVDVGPRGYAEMVDKAAELRQEIADLNWWLDKWETVTFGISALQAQGGKQRLIQLETELQKTEALIRKEEERMALNWKGRGKPPPGKPPAVPSPTPPAAPGAPAAPVPEFPAPSWEDLSDVGAIVFSDATSEGIEHGIEETTQPGGPLRGLGEAIGWDVREATKWGLIDGLKEGKVDAAGIVEEISDSMSTRFLDVGLEQMMEGLEEGFGDVFEAIGPKLGEALGLADMGPLSGAVQGAVATAAGIGISLITSAIGGTKSRQTFADIQRASATTDVREMRGIAVGETTVGIAEIGPRLENALAPLTAIMAEHLSVTRGILAAVRGGYGRGAGAALDAEISALLENSPSLTY